MSEPVDYTIPAGLELDYTGVDGYESDDWPQIQAKIDACNIAHRLHRATTGRRGLDG